ncbi:hypothetical protein JCM10914A_09860 [Paenibacillus sp. JCM 10914]|uniref:O-antigen ligase family protein n=1 Tax=Paenibacillus sp. JCM 10914 TaxID=1236974 RepID=UPI0003CC9A83|nr:O-antigen ligase family protein [Paenibacillus sp. JCM 10914]GAE07325.1 hypothetical protein JCM10914_3548 [Paenibacillus sp. JCM 10914]
MEFLIALIYIFHQMVDANLDLFYMLALILIVFDLLKRTGITIRAVLYFYWIALYATLLIYLNYTMDIPRLLVNTSKIFLCLFLYWQVRDMVLTGPMLKKIVHTISLVNVILLGIGLVLRTDLLWRMDDNVNIYQSVRLSLLYFEPSEASFHASILVILLMYMVLKGGSWKESRLSLFYMGTNAVIIILSAGIGAFGSMLLALAVMFYYHLFKRVTLKKAVAFISLLIVGIVAISIFVMSKNSFYLRFLDIINGNDGSVVYRFDVSFRVMWQMLIDSHWLGIGFGNLNTDLTRGMYYQFGLVEVISNSFMYVIAEGGIFMLIFLILFHIALIRKVRPEERLLKYALLMFIVCYQIAGGYFTNPVNWIVYGLIANAFYMSHEAVPEAGRSLGLKRMSGLKRQDSFGMEMKR